MQLDVAINPSTSSSSSSSSTSSSSSSSSSSSTSCSPGDMGCEMDRIHDEDCPLPPAYTTHFCKVKKRHHHSPPPPHHLVQLPRHSSPPPAAPHHHHRPHHHLHRFNVELRHYPKHHCVELRHHSPPHHHHRHDQIRGKSMQLRVQKLPPRHLGKSKKVRKLHHLLMRSCKLPKGGSHCRHRKRRPHNYNMPPLPPASDISTLAGSQRHPADPGCCPHSIIIREDSSCDQRGEEHCADAVRRFEMLGSYGMHHPPPRPSHRRHHKRSPKSAIYQVSPGTLPVPAPPAAPPNM